MSARSELRRRARAVLGGNIFAPEWLFAVLVVFVIQTILNALSSFGLSLIVTGPLTMGLSAYFLRRARREAAHDDLKVAIDGCYKDDLGGNVLIGLLITIFTALWMLLFIIPGIVKSYSYSMAYFIKLDNPSYTASDAIKESQRLMKGHKMELFLLDLSFIGWIFVGMLCLGIGLLWVTPYQSAAHAEFYKELVGDAVTVE